MPRLMKYAGLDLPIHQPETPVIWNKAALKKLSTSENDKAVRSVRLASMGIHSLKNALKKADTAFEVAAEISGAAVIRHEWGLIALPAKVTDEMQYFGQFNSHMLPEGYSLVAEIDVLRNVSALSPEECALIEEDIEDHLESRPKIVWAEHSPDQFARGIAPGEFFSKLHLVDIDPIIYVNPLA